MNNVNLKNGLRFVLLVLLQIGVFKQISMQMEYATYFHLFIYPIFIFLLPFRYSKVLIIFLSFFLGLSVDVFYDSIGIHAAACVFTAFIRPTVLEIIKPQSDYDVLLSPTISNFGFLWFLTYASIMLFAHLLFYFSVEAFTFVYIGQVLLKTIVSFIASMLFIIMYQFILNPK